MSEPLAEQRQQFRIADVFLGFVAATILANLGMGIATKAGGGSFAIFMGGMFGLWAGLLGSVLFASRRRGSGRLADDYWFIVKKRDILPGLGIGIACQLVLVPSIYLVLGLFVDVSGLGDVAENLIGEYGTGWKIVPLAIGLVLVAPLVEELFYRGQLLRVFAARTSHRLAVVGSAAVFGGFHFQLLQFLGLFIFGLVLAEIVMRTKRLGLSFFAHVGFNAVSLLIVGFF